MPVYLFAPNQSDWFRYSLWKKMFVSSPALKGPTYTRSRFSGM